MASTLPPSLLHDAFETLHNALNRLDAAADITLEENRNCAFAKETLQAEITESWQTHTKDLHSENSMLKEENAKLHQQIEALQEEYSQLQQAAGSVVQRLDSTISQLDMLK